MSIKVYYTKSGGIYFKPSEYAKTKEGKDLIKNISKSRLAKYIRSKS
jgi:hypothetical protein